MRYTSLIFLAVLYLLTGCGSKGALYLPERETEEVRPESIEEDTFQPETPQQELEIRETPQDEEEDK
jgi:predicted small lipoprotein YifL